MFGADKGTGDRMDGAKLRIGIVQARFNESITDALAQACLAELEALGVGSKHIAHIKVPGALEVPVALQALAEKDEYDALITGLFRATWGGGGGVTDPAAVAAIADAAGLDGASLPEPAIAVAEGHAVDVIVSEIMRQPPGTVTLCPIGPLTNVALAIVKSLLLRRNS